MDWFQAIEAASAGIGALAILYGVIRGTKYLKSNVALARQLIQTEQREKEAREAAEGFRLAADGWKAAVDQLSAQVVELRVEVKEQRVELGAAILYISDLIVHIKGGGKHDNLPPIPTILQDAVSQGFRNRETPSLSTGGH